MRARLSLLAVLGVVGTGFIYAAGLYAGVFSLVGYASGQERQQGFSSERWFPLQFGAPVWIAAGRAVQADFEVDARFGALSLTVWPPVVLRTSMQAATAYVAGRRSGSVLFVVGNSGWYSLHTDPTPVGGARCPRQRGMAEVLIGSSDCPTYDVSYRVVWRLADPGRTAADVPRLHVPRPHEPLATTYIR